MPPLSTEGTWYAHEWPHRQSGMIAAANNRNSKASGTAAILTLVAAIIREITPDGETITDSNRELLEHILTDLHAALSALTAQGRLLDKHDALLEEFRPLLDQFRSPLATALSRRRNGARKDPA